MPDYIFMLESRLSAEQRTVLERVQTLGREEGLNVYLSGGAVRDLLTGAPMRDFDFTVEGNPGRLVRELEKAGARIVDENESLRHYELLFPGEVDFSIAAARDEVYEHPGAKPETRWSSVIDDLRRRDFSINAIAISLNPASRGLLLDPTNGLADIEKREVRVLTMHAFTNQPVRILRILRFAARMGFQIESRTAEWMELAFERGLQETISAVEAGRELRELGREDNPIGILKEWGKRGLLGLFHAKLGKRTPNFDRLTDLLKVRDTMAASGYRAQLSAPVIACALGRLSSRELSGALSKLHLRAKEIERIVDYDDRAKEIVQMLQGRKTNTPRDAFAYLSSVPLDFLTYIQSECQNTKVLGKIKNFLYKWKPLRQQLPIGELESLGVPRGPQFDKIIEDFFQLQLLGRARNPQDRTPVLRKLAGIKPEKPKPVHPEKGKEVKKGKAKGSEKDKGRAEAAAAGAAAYLKKGRTAPAAPAAQASAVGKKAAKAAKPAPVKPSKPNPKRSAKKSGKRR